MNLIVTCPRHFEQDAAREIASLFERFGLEEPEARAAGMPGILTVRTPHDPVDVIRRVSETIEDEPWSVRYLQRLIPVQRSTASEIGKIVDGVKAIRSAMGSDKTYRITVEKRHSGLSSSRLIAEIADVIPNRVSLKNPDMVVLVEILGATAGVSVVEPGDILSVERKKRSLSEED